MTRRTHSTLPLLSTGLTAVVSVTLVLLLLGIAAIGGISTNNLATQIRQSVGFTVLFNDDATASDINGVIRRFAAAPYVASSTYSSPEQVMDRWQQMIGDDEPIDSLLGVNPFSPEIEVHVKARYASADSLAVITAPLEMVPGVAEVKLQSEMIAGVNTAIRNAAITLGAVALALLLIAIVLINNTVRLTIHARRFSIHTMKLVGATPGFIRRPLIRDSVLAGLVAGFVAAALLAGLIVWAVSEGSPAAGCFSWEDAAWVLGAMPLAGMAICLPAAFFAANKYIRISQDKIYR